MLEPVSGGSGDKNFVTFTMRMPKALRGMLADEAKHRRGGFRGESSESSIVREALVEWAEKRGKLPQAAVS